MIYVKNRKLIRQLAYRDFRNAKARNIIAVSAIILTTILFTSLFTLGTGMMESMQRADMIMSGGDGHAIIEDVSESEFQIIRDHPLIMEVSYYQQLADQVDNDSLIKRHTEFWYYDDIGLEYAFIELAGGSKPHLADEVITDTKTLELLGVPQQVGAPLTLEFTVDGEQLVCEFVLAGWWESYPGLQFGTIIASRAYLDTYVSVNRNVKGKIKFADSVDIEANLETVITESGFSMDSTKPNYINTGINPFYLSMHARTGLGTLIALLCALLLFVFTGYLIIYNIFQISVLRDIRLYGLLKTIGTTGRQLSAMIRIQAWLLSLIGIPLGLIFGYFLGKVLLPIIIAGTNITGNMVVVSPNVLIFFGAAAFTLFTVFICTLKPAQIVAKVSPIEATRYNDINSDFKVKIKKSKYGGTPSKMAWANLGRNRKRTMLVILSLSLSIVLANTVFIFSQSVNPDQALKNTIDSDFRIGHVDLFNYRYRGKEESALSESFIAAVEKNEIKAGGRQYGRPARYTSETTIQSVNLNLDGSYSTNIYGLDSFSFARLRLIAGEMDLDKLSTGKYVLEGVWADTRGNLDEDSMNHNIGDLIKLDLDGNIIELTILGHVIANETNTYDWVGSCFFLPGEVYKEITGQTFATSYVFDVNPTQEADMELFLKWYTDNVEPVMGYQSKFTIIAGITDIKNTIIMIGGALALIIGIIGILNFINSVLTAILTRQREFAILQSVGMTKRQLVKMLCFEGYYYALLTAPISILLSLGSALLIVQPLCEQIWFLKYQFSIRALVVMLSLLFGLGALIPYIMYRRIEQRSIVERLRN